MTRMQRNMIVTATTAIVGLGISSYVYVQNMRPKILEVYVFSLTQGRSVFVRTPDDTRVLIDGGANSEVITKLTSILPFYSRRIDTVIVVHDDKKDITGLIDVIRRYKVSNVFVSKDVTVSTSPSDIYTILLDTARRSGIPIQEISASDSINFGLYTKAQVLFPVTSNRFTYSSASPPEMVLNIMYKSTRILLANSISKKIQNFLVENDENISAQVCVYDEHVTHTTVSQNFIRAINPTYVVYSSTPAKTSSKGSASKKKADKDPLDSILVNNRFNVKEKGTIKIVSDGSTVSIQ
ncbi:MAG: hypothetical protein WCG07_00320 [Candidatus Taylorbacteria bacterium]